MKVRASPSGSLKMLAALTQTKLPAVMGWSGIDPDVTGGRLGCGAGLGATLPSPPQAAAQVTATSASG